jgi:gliding motility-associatede transport system auxiliary component
MIGRRLVDNRRRRSIAALVCIGLLLIAANILVAHYLPQRLDLTKERLYTLSSATRLTLAHIDEPLTLRFYYSPQLGESVPTYGVYAQRVGELLDRYVAASQGKVRLEIYHPEPFSDAEDRAEAFGLQGVPLGDTGEKVYFGLAGTNSTDDQQVIPFFSSDREPMLEYDLTRVVHMLAYPKRPAVSVISGLPLDANPEAAATGMPSPPLAVLQQLRQIDDVANEPASLEAVPTGTDVAMVVQPQNLPGKTLFAIDQFVLHGGKALVFVDPYSEMAAHDGMSRPPLVGDPAPLLKAWGIKLLPDTVAADRRNARRVMAPGPGGSQEMDYVAWLNIGSADLSHDDPITASLHHVALASAGIIEPIEGAATKFEPLMTTSSDAMKLPVEKVKGLPDVAGLLAHFNPDGQRHVLAARITGPAQTAFPDGPPKPPPAAAPDKSTKPEKPAEASDFLRKSEKPINIVVVADSDILNDRLWARTQNFFGRPVVIPLADNGDFVTNTVDVLAGGEDLVGLRSRGTSIRPFVVVDHIRQQANAQYAAEEQALEQKLKATQAKLRDLTEGGASEAKTALTPEQAAAVTQFRADLRTTRTQLRAVQAALRQNIDWLKTILEFVDIALMPILVAAAALVLAALRRQRWRRRAAPGIAA